MPPKPSPDQFSRRRGDIALEIKSDAANSPSVRGASVFYIANNSDRKSNGEQLLVGLLRRVPQLPNRGVKPDTDSGLGSLAFCRQTTLPALAMQVGFLSNQRIGLCCKLVAAILL